MEAVALTEQLTLLICTATKLGVTKSYFRHYHSHQWKGSPTQGLSLPVRKVILLLCKS